MELNIYINSLMPDSGISCALALEVPQSCTKPLKWNISYLYILISKKYINHWMRWNEIQWGAIITIVSFL